MKDGPQGFLGAERLERFRERIAVSLRDRPQELGPEEHRQALADQLATLGERNFFQLLGVGPATEEGEVHRAYTELARLVHPSHAAGLSLRGREPALELLFERVTEAYLTLSDPDLRMRYRRSLEGSGWRPEALSGEARAEEKRREARRQFLIAQRLADDGAYHDAVQLLEQIVRLDSRGEYFALLGLCLARNPNWTQEAINRYIDAVHLEPRVAEYRRELGMLFERAGNRARARQHLESAAELDPTDEVIQEALARLAGGDVARGRGGPSWWAKLARRLGGEPGDEAASGEDGAVDDPHG
jgi:curved DNA-binding protein CbpA